ncbi:MRN complex-interacting protein isoform X2 [Megalobrama amblycephala]|uniref:MRN complex-interacting protein isoform X2 n=1 Tax=Megalobrama amblycephala TaxID=75352 RepID=UPI00201407EA|nr:MRN complex-interacting protein isoform X2 [Megalobrama amblycephala]
MVQEFHVLRCFSCQTFQVQQVKKSKKWACKVCGEKQSLIKEFGRGAAADCRRHVQKLNALRGRLQEVSSERLGSQWEQDDEYENEDVNEDLDQDPMDKSEQEVTHVSRWSKYTDPSAEDPDEHEDEEEDENVYTERQRFRSQGTRKRKKISTLKSFAGRDEGCEDEEPQTGSSGFKRPNLDRRFSSAGNEGFASCSRSDDVDTCSSTNLPSSRQAVFSYPTAGSRSTFTEEDSGNKQQCISSHKPPAVDVTSPSVSSRQKFGETKIEKDSKWNKFLSVVASQQDEEEYDYHDHYNDNTVTPYFTEALEGMGVDCEERRYPSDIKVNGVCVDGKVSKSHASKPSGFENPVCEQPPLLKMPCSKLSFSSLFLTDEDFDDTF